MATTVEIKLRYRKMRKGFVFLTVLIWQKNDQNQPTSKMVLFWDGTNNKTSFPKSPSYPLRVWEDIHGEPCVKVLPAWSALRRRLIDIKARHYLFVKHANPPLLSSQVIDASAICLTPAHVPLTNHNARPIPLQCREIPNNRLITRLVV